MLCSYSCLKLRWTNQWNLIKEFHLIRNHIERMCIKPKMDWSESITPNIYSIACSSFFRLNSIDTNHKIETSMNFENRPRDAQSTLHISDYKRHFIFGSFNSNQNRRNDRKRAVWKPNFLESHKNEKKKINTKIRELKLAKKKVSHIRRICINPDSILCTWIFCEERGFICGKWFNKQTLQTCISANRFPFFCMHNSFSLALSMPIVFNIALTVFGENIISLCTPSDILLQFPGPFSIRILQISQNKKRVTLELLKQIIYKTFGFTWPIRIQIQMFAFVSRFFHQMLWTIEFFSFALTTIDSLLFK